MKKYFLIISLFICFNLTAAEIEIISDKPGDGKKIIYHSWVQIEYTGSFENGKVFDTNIGKDRPLVIQMGMKEVIPGFEQGIIGTTKGTKRKIKIPAELAYGEKGGGDVIPPNTDLIFEFEIIDLLDPHYKMINSDELIKRIDAEILDKLNSLMMVITYLDKDEEVDTQITYASKLFLTRKNWKAIGSGVNFNLAKYAAKNLIKELLQLLSQDI